MVAGNRVKPDFIGQRNVLWDNEINKAGLTRLELAASCVTGRRSNQLNYNPVILRTMYRLSKSVLNCRSSPRCLPPIFNGRYWIRTSDPLRVRQVL